MFYPRCGLCNILPQVWTVFCVTPGVDCVLCYPRCGLCSVLPLVWTVFCVTPGVDCVLCHPRCGLCSVSPQVWKQKKVWEGFVRCCQRTKPQSFQVLLQLPALQLKNAFEICPDLREPLLHHVKSFTPHQVSDLL